MKLLKYNQIKESVYVSKSLTKEDIKFLQAGRDTDIEDFKKYLKIMQKKHQQGDDEQSELTSN